MKWGLVDSSAQEVKIPFIYIVNIDEIEYYKKAHNIIEWLTSFK